MGWEVRDLEGWMVGCTDRQDVGGPVGVIEGGWEGGRVMKKEEG